MFEILSSKPCPNEDLFHLVAIENGDPEYYRSNIEDLLSKGADINYSYPTTGRTLLMYAIERQNAPLMEIMLQLGANPNQVNTLNNMHPLVYAAIQFAPSVNGLLDAGADAMIPDMELGVPVGQLAIGALPPDYNDIKARIEDIMLGARQTSFDDTTEYNNNPPHVLGDWVNLNREILKEKSENRKHFLSSLYETGATRIYGGSPDINALMKMEERFPNFSEAIKAVRNQVGLYNLSKRKSFYMSPILLAGEGGVGKTRFARELAKVLGLEFTLIGCGTVTAGWVIGGSSTSWSEGRPGMVHTAMREGKTANPLLMLDEIDKLNGDSRFNAFGPLFQLLEKHTAVNFVDEAVSFPIDCSCINWIATANDLDQIPKPILSRFIVIDIPNPTKEQTATIARNIYREFIEDNRDTWGSAFAPTLPDELVRVLSDYSPREISKMMLDAFGNAAGKAEDLKNDPHGITPDYIELTLDNFEVISATAKQKRGPGFI